MILLTVPVSLKLAQHGDIIHTTSGLSGFGQSFALRSRQASQAEVGPAMVKSRSNDCLTIFGEFGSRT